jgi:hypothetical protein
VSVTFPYEQLRLLQEAPFAVAISEGTILFPAIETVHVLALTLVVGLIARLDLSLLGVGNRSDSPRSLAREILPLTWIAFAVAVASGGLLFSSNAVHYFDNAAFRIKFVLLLLAGVNMLIFHAINSGHDGATNSRGPARAAGAISLLLWCAIVAAGRWIGFINAP